MNYFKSLTFQLFEIKKIYKNKLTGVYIIMHEINSGGLHGRPQVNIIF